jgi:hypothetical protein
MQEDQSNNAGNDVATAAGTEGVSARRSPASAIETVRFDLLRSAIYHDMRQRFFSRVEKFALFLTVVLASGAIAAFGSQFPVIGQAAGVAVAVVSSAQLVWNYGGSARDHEELRRRFYHLLAQAEDGSLSAGELTNKMTLVFADEPPLIGRTNRAAHNIAGKNMFGDDFERA